MDNFDDIEDDFFDEIFYDDTYVPITLYSGTQYAGFTIADLLAYTRPVLNLKPITTKVSSTKELTDFLTTQWPSNEVQNALNRMRAVVVDTWDWGPDVLVKILPDLDVAFFNGLLKNKIQVSWQDESSIQAQEFPSQNFEYDLGATEFDKLSGICHVYLNRYNISDEVNAREAMLQTLLHELVHAWDKLMCPEDFRDHRDTYQQWVSNHGWHFRWILNLLDERTQQYLGFSTIGDWEDYRIADMAAFRSTLPF